MIEYQTEFVTDSLKNISFEQLSAEAPAIREKINRFRSALGHHLVNKQSIIDLMTVAAIAQEPLLLVGPPGTAKSDLVVKFKDALTLDDGDYFEYMLTRFTEPAEVLGPIDINVLREGRYLRRIQGKLPTAKLVFLDEIFKSNSAILNTLLTIINERKFYQDGVPLPVQLKILFGAANEIPEHTELGALRDRFCLKASCHSVQETHFFELIDAGLEGQLNQTLNRKPWAEGHASLQDFLKAHLYLSRLMARKDLCTDGKETSDRDLFFREDLLNEMRRVLRTIARENHVFISDRKIIKIYRLIRTYAWVLHGGAVEREDLRLLSYLGDTREEVDVLEEKVPHLLGINI